MCAVPILICSHWAARGTNMVRCLAAPLSPREISQLLDLRHGKSQSDPAGFKRFIILYGGPLANAAAVSSHAAG
jgi:hypothetical protein